MEVKKGPMGMDIYKNKREGRLRAIFSVLLSFALVAASFAAGPLGGGDGAEVYASGGFTEGEVYYEPIGSGTVQVGDGENAAISTDRTGDIDIPDTVTHDSVTYSVTAVADRAFSFCDISGVTLPNTVGSIGDYAFSYCYDMTSATLTNTVTSIGEGAFYFCESLTNMSLPANLVSIGISAFESNALTSVNIPGTVTQLGVAAFRNNLSLENVSIGVGVTKLPDSLFWGCEEIRDITIPASVTAIDKGAFNGCSKLTDITFSGSAAPSVIANDAFAECDLLAAIHVPSGRTAAYKSALEPSFAAAGMTLSVKDSATLKVSTGRFIYGGALYKVISQSPLAVQLGNGVSAAIPTATTGEITIPSTVSDGSKSYKVTAVGDRAFAISDISGVTLPDTLTSIGDAAFAHCYLLSRLNLPNSVKSIGDEAFYLCENLSELTLPASSGVAQNAAFSADGIMRTALPSGLVSIGSRAFSGSGIKTLTIPASVKTIGAYAFRGCSALTLVTFTGSVPPKLGADVFKDCGALAAVKVPAGTLAAYKSALAGTGIPASSVDDGVIPIKETTPYKTDKEGRPILTAPPSPANPLDISKLSGKALVIANKEWTGKQIKSGLAVSVSYVINGKAYTNAMKQNSCYVLSKPGKNKNIGKATVTITGKAGSSYKGAKALSFKIVPKKPTALKLKAGKKSLKITFKKVSKGQGVKTYKIEYRVKGAAKWKSKTLKVKLTGKAAKAKTVSLTLKKLTSKKTYQVRVFAYKGVYEGYPTGVKRFKVK